jgi:hypothetical protein
VILGNIFSECILDMYLGNAFLILYLGNVF